VHECWKPWDLSLYKGPVFLADCGVSCIDEAFARQHLEGRSALHFAAKVLGQTDPDPALRTYRGFHSHAKYEEWRRLCQHLIQKGADLQLMANTQYDQSENCFFISGSPLDFYLFARTLDHTIALLYKWTELLSSSGICVKQYWLTQESVRRRQEHMCWTISPAVSLNQEKDKSGSEGYAVHFVLKGHYTQAIYKSGTRDIPGKWQSTCSKYLPRTIIWSPDELDEAEDASWSKDNDSSVCIEMGPITDSDHRSRHNGMISDSFNVTLHGTQDDAGMILLPLNRARSDIKLKRRSASQPPPYDRGGKTHAGSNFAENHRWFPSVHFCPHDSRRSLGCEFQWSELLDMEAPNLRTCYTKTRAAGDIMYDGAWRHTMLPLICGRWNWDYYEEDNKNWRCSEHERWAFSSALWLAMMRAPYSGFPDVAIRDIDP
jgi:hypothetical protein